MKRLMVLLAVVCLTNLVIAQERAPTTAPETHTTEHTTTSHADGDAHPVLSTNSNWAGSMVIIVIAMFVCAAVVGVVVRLNMPEAPPEPVHDDHAHGHDDQGHGTHGHNDHSKGGGHGH